MAAQFTHRCRVEFTDTDAAGIAHFTAVFRWMEQAEHAYLRSLGFSVHGEHDGVPYGFPRGEVSARFHRPVRFEDELEVHVTVAGRSRSTITYAHRVTLAGRGDAVIAEGTVKVVHVERQPDGGFRAAPLPDALTAALPAVG